MKMDCTEDLIHVNVPDPTWTETDPAGHVHSWAAQTWRRVQTAPPTDEYPASYEDRCAICGARVWPRTVTREERVVTHIVWRRP